MWTWIKQNRVTVMTGLSAWLNTIVLLLLIGTARLQQQRDAEQERRLQALTATVRELIWEVIELKTDRYQDPLPQREK